MIHWVYFIYKLTLPHLNIQWLLSLKIHWRIGNDLSEQFRATLGRRDRLSSGSRRFHLVFVEPVFCDTLKNPLMEFLPVENCNIACLYCQIFILNYFTGRMYVNLIQTWICQTPFINFLIINSNCHEYEKSISFSN